MKKIKKIFAVLLSMAMVMGMSVTAFAADKTAAITIKNAGSATFEYVQVIKADTSTETGWSFADTQIESSYLKAYGMESAQELIKTLISGNDASKTQAALSDVLLTHALSQAAGNPITVNTAGVYAIKGKETGYAFSPMAAYIAFENYDTTSGVPTTLKDKEVEAKKAPTTVVKTSDDEDKIVEIGREVTYSVTSTVPYIADGTENPKYIVTDTISGAAYVTNGKGNVEVSVKIGGNEAKTYEAAPNGNTFTLDLSDILVNNTNANNTIVIQYKATVTDTLIGNTVKLGNGTNGGDAVYGSDNDKLVTGEITLTKTGDADAKLAGAEFVVYKEGSDNAKSYAKFDENNKLAGWTATEADATKVITGADGAVKVQGLDAATVYNFKEVKAPEGYSINTTDSKTTWGTLDDTLDNVVVGATSMKDTKISALPSTGGIGTTIFTIGGCVIMIGAAALFFKSRKKSDK